MPISSCSDSNGRTSYVPPHLRNRPPSAEGASAPISHSGALPLQPAPRNGGCSTRIAAGAWNNRGNDWDRGREREPNPFRDDLDTEPEFASQENTGINFDAYEDIPVETSGRDVPPPVNTFAQIDLGEALNLNIKRCKYVKPTPVQKYAIPISLAGRDLMACAQTGSGKTAAFCFPIISGIMRCSNRPAPAAPSFSRMAYPLALILSPTRELSVQVRFRRFVCFLHSLLVLQLQLYLCTCRFMKKLGSLHTKLVSGWWLLMAVHP